MKILDIDKFNETATALDRLDCFSVLSPLDNRFADIVDVLSEADASGLVSILNKINNQGITSIDVITYSYIIDGSIKLRYSDMATSELLFLFSYAVCVAKRHVFISNYLQQLKQKTCKLYFSIFGNSEYIDFLVEEEDSYYYQALLNGDM